MATQSRVGWKPYVNLAAATYLLNTYSGAAAAYSLRKLNSNYTGSAISVRRSSDNTSTDIGFDANGNLDTTSLLSFVGGYNVLQYSENFENVYYSKTGTTVTTDQTTSPIGDSTADLVMESGSSFHVFGRFGGSSTWASGTSYNSSIYIKRTSDANSPTKIAFSFDYGTSNTRPYVIFDIQNGTVVNYNFFTDINGGYSITDAGNGWWRISMYGTLTSAQSTFDSGALIRFNNNENNIRITGYTPQSNSGVYLWGYQLNKQSTTDGLQLQSYSKTTSNIAGHGFVSVWYDQSGNAKNASQITASTQPQIVSAGSVIRSNSKPAISFTGGRFLTSSSVARTNANDPMSMYGVYRLFSTTRQSQFKWGTSEIEPGANSVGVALTSFGSFAYSPNNSAYWSTNLALVSIVFTGGVITNTSIYYNGTARAAYITNGANGNLQTSGAITIGKGTFSNGNSAISELMFFPTGAQNANVNLINVNINSYYSIY